MFFSIILSDKNPLLPDFQGKIGQIIPVSLLTTLDILKKFEVTSQVEIP